MLDCFKHLNLNKRQILYAVLIVLSALMIGKGLMVVTGCEKPILILVSGGMEPTFHRGDILFLTNHKEDPVRVGDIVAFKVEGQDLPIVHRVIKIHEENNGAVKFLTKGDNRPVDDRLLYYAPGQLWLEKKDIVGRVRGTLPYIGIVSLHMNDYPKFKILYAVVLSLSVLMIWKGLMVVVTGCANPIVVLGRKFTSARFRSSQEGACDERREGGRQ